MSHIYTSCVSLKSRLSAGQGLRMLSLLLFIGCNLACRPNRVDRPANNRPPMDLKEKMVSINQYLTEKDKDIIEHYIRRQGWKMEFCSDGYYYEILEAGVLPKAIKGNHVTFDYTIRLLDGTLCYTSTGADPAVFVVDGSEEVSGMHLAVKRLGKKARARFIFPPQLGHGLQGDLNKIPPRSVLVYTVEVLEIE